MPARRILIVASVAALCTIGPALAQTGATDTETQTPVLLSPEKQALVREQIKRSDLPAANLSEPARIGMIVPPEMNLLVLPQDAGRDVPTVTSYKFFLSGDVIAVVEPESRKVIQLIQR